MGFSVEFGSSVGFGGKQKFIKTVARRRNPDFGCPFIELPSSKHRNDEDAADTRLNVCD